MIHYKSGCGPIRRVRHRSGRLVLASAIALLTSSNIAGAQEQTPAAAANPLAAKGQLAPAHVDASFGFSLRFPAGSIIEREKRFVSTADVEIVRFVQLEHTWSLVVRLSKTTRPLTSDMIIEGITSKLSAEHTELKVIRAEPTRIAAREGVRYAATFTADDKDWLRQQAVIGKQPTEFYTLILIAPLDDKQIATETFDKIAESFQILRSELTQEHINAALERGEALRRTVANDKTRLSARPEQDAYLRFVQDGQEIGFVHVHQGPKRLKHRQGLGIREWGWLFKPDKSITQLRHEMFLADDLVYATWDNRVRTLIPQNADRGAKSTISVETGLRQHDKLLVSYTPVFSTGELKDKVIQVEPSFASPAWFVLLPRIVDLTKPELYAFSAYSSDRHGLILRTFRVAGPTQVTLDGQTRSAIKLEDSEGLIPPISEIDVEPTSQILRVSAGPLEMLATTRQYVDQHYKSRVDEALATFKKYPLPTLRPADRKP